MNFSALKIRARILLPFPQKGLPLCRKPTSNSFCKKYREHFSRKPTSNSFCKKYREHFWRKSTSDGFCDKGWGCYILLSNELWFWGIIGFRFYRLSVSLGVYWYVVADMGISPTAVCDQRLCLWTPPSFVNKTGGKKL